MEKQNITIEDLARMVQKGFNENKDREKDFKNWTMQRFDGMDKQFQAIRKQLTGIVYRYEFEDLEMRVKELENLFAMDVKKN